MKKINCKLLLPTGFFLCCLFLDYINISDRLGIMSQNINLDLMGIVFDAMIVITIYIISFFYIDNRQNEKDSKAQDAANVIFEKTYRECVDNLNYLDDKELVAKYIIPKIDGNKTDSENKIIHNLQTLPFTTLETIMSLAASGYISKEAISEYLEIKKEYQYLISTKITFFDLIDPKTEEQIAMFNNIKKRDEKLKIKLQSLITKEPENLE